MKAHLDDVIARAERAAKTRSMKRRRDDSALEDDARASKLHIQADIARLIKEHHLLDRIKRYAWGISEIVTFQDAVSTVNTMV